ncbi:MAG: hypothetical protein U0625_05300 [Phycisphaerales bacterium]
MALALASATASTLMAAVPPPERLPVTTQVSATGLPTPAPYFTPFASHDVRVLLSRGNSPGESPATPQTIVARWWQRTEDGTWIWQGTLEVPGWPARGPVATSVPIGSLSAEADGATMLVLPISATQFEVARHEGGQWSSLGAFILPFSEQNSNLQIRDGVVFGQSPQRVWRASRDAKGAWQVVERSFESLGLGAGTSRKWVFPLSADGFLLQWRAAGEPAATPLHYDRCTVTASGIERGPQQPPLVPEQTAIWTLGASGDDAVAVIARNDLETGGSALDTIAFLRRGADGLYATVQVEQETVASAYLANTALAALGSGRVLVLGRLWSRDADGHWCRGALIPPSASPVCAGIGVNSVTLGATALRDFANAFDCDGDGIDDAVAIAHGWATDCNANGHPDDCDIALGMVTDADHDGVPDHCASDCDANGVADIAQIRAGARESCAGDGTLASCQIAAGELDRDGNGVPDLCDADRNGNGIPDILEIVDGTATDCDGDWRIDDAPAASVAWPPESTGWGFFGGSQLATPGIVLMTSVTMTDAMRSIDGFRFPVTVGPSLTQAIDGRPLMAFVAIDPTNDLDPRDAQVVWWQATVFAPDRAHPEYLGTPGFGLERLWQYIATPHLPVDAPAVWIGFTYPPQVLWGDANPLCAAFNAVTAPWNALGQGAIGKSWVAYSTQAIPSSPEAAMSLPGFGPAGMTATVQVYSRGCALIGDVDGNGRVDGADLGRLLGDWGPAYGSPCDLNHDNSVDGADLAILIAHFNE